MNRLMNVTARLHQVGLAHTIYLSVTILTAFPYILIIYHPNGFCFNGSSGYLQGMLTRKFRRGIITQNLTILLINKRMCLLRAVKNGVFMKGYIYKLLMANAKFDKNEAELKYKFIFLSSAFLGGIVLAAVVGIVLWHDNRMISIIDFCFSGIGIFLLIYLLHHKEKTEGIATIALILTFLVIYSNFLFDTDNTMRIALFFLIAAAVYYLKGRKQGRWWLVFIMASILLGYFLSPDKLNYTNLDMFFLCCYLIRH